MLDGFLSVIGFRVGFSKQLVCFDLLLNVVRLLAQLEEGLTELNGLL